MKPRMLNARFLPLKCILCVLQSTLRNVTNAINSMRFVPFTYYFNRSKWRGIPSQLTMKRLRTADLLSYNTPSWNYPLSSLRHPRTHWVPNYAQSNHHTSNNLLPHDSFKIPTMSSSKPAFSLRCTTKTPSISSTSIHRNRVSHGEDEYLTTCARHPLIGFWSLTTSS